MNSECEVLVEELKKISNNSDDNNSGIYLTHSEVISFVKSFIIAAHEQYLSPFIGWKPENVRRIMFHLNLIRVSGINHRDRSRAARRCLEIIEQQCKEVKQISGYPDDKSNNDWENIPW